MSAPYMFDLTGITGRRRNDDRVVTWKAVEINRRLFHALLLGSAVAAPIAVAFVPMLGSSALVVFAIVVSAWLFLFYRRTTKGLRTTTFQALRDWRKAANRRFYQSMVQVDDTWFEPSQIVYRSLPVVTHDTDLSDEIDEMLGLESLDGSHLPGNKAKGTSSAAPAIDVDDTFDLDS